MAVHEHAHVFPAGVEVRYSEVNWSTLPKDETHSLYLRGLMNVSR